MALTFAHIGRGGLFRSNLRVLFTEATFDASYPTGGEAVSVADLGVPAIVNGAHLDVVATGPGTTVTTARWDQTNKKIVCFGQDGAEVAATQDLSTTKVRMIFFY